MAFQLQKDISGIWEFFLGSLFPDKAKKTLELF